MNKTTTMTMCVVMLMIGMAFTAVAATRSDSSGETPFDVSGTDNLGSYTILNETFTVVKDPEQDYFGKQFAYTSVIVDMKDVPESCFIGSNMSKLILTGNVETVAEDAFAKNRSLISVSRCGTGALDIAENAFEGCTCLKYVDLRGEVTVADGAFPSGLTAMRAVDTDGEAPYATGETIRIRDTGGEIAATMYDGSCLRVCYAGKGMLQLADADGNRAEYTKVSGAFDTYKFTPIWGQDTTLGYRVIHIKYNLEDIPDVDAEMTGSTYKLLDLAEGATSTKWLGWKDRVNSQYLIKEFGHDFVDTYCNNAGSVLDLVSQASSYTIYYIVGKPVPGESNIPYLTSASGNGTSTYSSIPDTDHYTCVGWTRSDDQTHTVYPCGSYIRYFAQQHMTAVWEPKEGCTHSVQYTNVDGTDLGEPERLGWGMDATIGDVAPMDETPTRMIDGWTVEGTEDVLRTGDTFAVNEDTRLIPVLRDRKDVVVTFDDAGSERTMTVKEGYPTPITVEDPKETYRLFVGWTVEGTGLSLRNGDAVTMDEDTVLTSVWRDKESYRVSFMSEGVQIGETRTVLETDEIRVHADVSRSHFVLSGWSDGDAVVADGSDYSVTGNVTFTAVWTEMAKHTVTYHPADGSAPSVSAYVGSTVKIGADPGTRQGYDFLGWSVSGGSVVQYCNGDPMEVVADVDLYPVWMRNGDPLPTDSGGDSSSGGSGSSDAGRRDPEPAPSPSQDDSRYDDDDDRRYDDDDDDSTPAPTPVIPLPVIPDPTDGSADSTDGTIPWEDGSGSADGTDAVPDEATGGSGSGSGGSGIGTGAGIAALAAVSALVVAFLAVVLRRS